MSGEFAGRLRARIAIMRRDGSRDALAGGSGSWTTLGTAWAMIEPAGIGPASVAEAPSGLPRWQVTLRAGADVVLGDRLLWRGRRLRVRAVRKDPAAADRITLDTEEER